MGTESKLAEMRHQHANVPHVFQEWKDRTLAALDPDVAAVLTAAHGAACSVYGEQMGGGPGHYEVLSRVAEAWAAFYRGRLEAECREPKESDKPVGQLYVENLARMGADEETVERARQVAAQHPSATRVPTEPEVGNPWRPTYDKRQEMWNRFNEGTATKNDGMSLVYYCDALEAECDALRVSRDEWRETALHAIRGIDSIDRTIKEALNDR